MNVLFLTPTEIRLLTACRAGGWHTVKAIKRRFPGQYWIIVRLTKLGFLEVRERVLKYGSRRVSHRRLSKMYRTSQLAMDQLSRARLLYSHSIEPFEAKMKRMLDKPGRRRSSTKVQKVP